MNQQFMTLQFTGQIEKKMTNKQPKTPTHVLNPSEAVRMIECTGRLTNRANV